MVGFTVTAWLVYFGGLVLVLRGGGGDFCSDRG